MIPCCVSVEAGVACPRVSKSPQQRPKTVAQTDLLLFPLVDSVFA